MMPSKDLYGSWMKFRLSTALTYRVLANLAFLCSAHRHAVDKVEDFDILDDAFTAELYATVLAQEDYLERPVTYISVFPDRGSIQSKIVTVAVDGASLAARDPNNKHITVCKFVLLTSEESDLLV
ncbi:exported hypothetical protein [Agrobacterium genomosp. 13 str. CFBP 6927]|uniref:Uncharacterized protein n=1 Tax=Agrobacterium genomosp. 13 str. CFBP 6927 TaxID=1183428 RepID=A0ABM9VLB5_9HYPH|nr:exported hypothetical protein [Agrobacterium genomosp. 13 str. CFBP 6927]